MSTITPSSPSHPSRAFGVFAGAVGVLLGVALLKFGNPVIFDDKISAPSGVWEFLIWSWPVLWGYALLAVVFLLGFRFLRRPQGVPGWFIWLPAAWFIWQCLSATQTVRWGLTEATLKHFAAAVACYYLGLLALNRTPKLTPVWVALLAAFIAMVAAGFDQHFGGLEATRRFVHAQPDWQNLPPDFLKKVESNRIYATLFYPNALAGAVLLFTPVLLAFALSLLIRPMLRWGLALAVGGGGLSCLYWSGSKGGWLIALTLGLAAWLHLDVNKKVKWLVLAGVLVAGLAGFFVRNAAYFEKGATSVGARLDYWRAALRITTSHPVFGSGPGTFSVRYRELKRPEAEMSRLVHNDYLEQASDSGVIALVLYSALLVGSLIGLYPRGHPGDWVRLGVWLGLTGWATQSVVEFGLYIPALAWPAFLFLGWMWGTNRIDKAGPAP